jgi:hypothetical protein
MEQKNEKQVTNLQVVEIDHHKFAVELLSGNCCVNLTQLAKPYGQSKRPVDWLKTDEACQYIDTLSEVKKSTTADLVIVKKGGIPGNQGTWCTDRRIAIRFAQWLSPQFAIAVDDLILRLLTRQAVLADNFNGVEPVINGGKLWYNYLDVLESLGKSRKSGSVAARKRLYPQHFVKLFGRNFITPKFCNFLKTQSDAHQLKLDFIFTNKAVGGQS